MDDLSRDERIAHLQQQLAERDALIAVQQEQLESQRQLIESLASEVKLLKRALFGNRRERFDDPNQGTLFDGQWVGPSPEEDVPEEEADASTAPSTKRKQRGKLVFPESLPRKEQVHRLQEEDIPEHLRDRDDVRRFRKKVREYVELVPPSAYVVEEYVEMLAADNADATETEMISATRPPRILDCYAGPSLLAGLATERFADYLPYYRVEERLQRLELTIPRSTIARWMMKLSEQLLPLVELMRQAVFASDVVCMDETPVKLLQPGLGEAATAYLWTAVGDEAHPYNVFYFTEDRSRAGPEAILQDYQGVLVSDAYVCYESLQSEWAERMQWACCHAHARRKFEELDYLGSTPATTKALAYYRQLFDLEDEFRALTDEQRLAMREQHSVPVWLSFKQWLKEHEQALRPKHPLRGPIQYITKRVESFERFLKSGAIPLENNAAERSIKLSVIAKKNHLFFASPGGGTAATVFYSLTATCRRLHIDPTAYLRDVFERLPQMSGGQVSSLLPDRWLAEHPQHRVIVRAEETTSRAARKRSTRAKRRKALKRKLQSLS